MSWGHAILELGEDADQRAVKRAYAKRLRTTRPDDDPAGFQQLYEAYQAALDWARHREQWQQEDNDGDGAFDKATDAVPGARAAQDPVQAVEHSETDLPGTAHCAPAARQPDPLPQPPPLEMVPAAFAQRVIEEGRQSEPASFERWLQQCPELWSLGDKPAISVAVWGCLMSSPGPFRAPNFDLLADCFGWFDVDNVHDAYDMDAYRRHLHYRWVLQPNNDAALADFLHREQPPVTMLEARARVERLSGPWQPWRSLWAAWPAGRVAAMHDTLSMLGIDRTYGVTQPPSPLQPAQIGFWLALADRQRLSGPRMQLALLRGLLCALLVLGMAVLFALLGDLMAMGRGGDAVMSARVLRGACYAAGAVLVVGTLWPLLRVFFQWQVANEDVPVRWRLLRLWLIPVMAISALLLIHPADARLTGNALAWFTLGLAVRRWWQRGGYVFQFNAWLLLAAVPFLKLGGLALAFGEVAVVGALLAWTVDAMTQVVHRR